MEEKKYLKWYHKVGYGSGDIAGNCVYALLTAFMIPFQILFFFHDKSPSFSLFFGICANLVLKLYTKMKLVAINRINRYMHKITLYLLTNTPKRCIIYTQSH